MNDFKEINKAMESVDHVIERNADALVDSGAVKVLKSSPRGGYKYDLEMNIVDPVTLLDGDILKHCGPDRLDEVMKKLSKTAKELGCVIVMENGKILVDTEVEGFIETFRDLDRKHKRVALSCGKPISLKEPAFAEVYDFETEEAEKTQKPIYLPPRESWKQGRLRRGPGHNKHSRKGKKK